MRLTLYMTIYHVSYVVLRTFCVHRLDRYIRRAKDNGLVKAGSNGTPRGMFASIIILHFISGATQAASQMIPRFWPVG